MEIFSIAFNGVIAMKRTLKILIPMLLSFPLGCFAGWQVASPATTVPNEPFFQAGNQQDTTFSPTSYGASGFPNQFAGLGRPAALYAVTVSGSLKENIERIMDRYHWKVVWKAQYDYNFDGKVTGSSLPDVVGKLLLPFPLQAKMYMANRTVAIVARRP